MKVVRWGMGLVLATLIGVGACGGTEGTAGGGAGETSVGGEPGGGDGHDHAGGADAGAGAAGRMSEGGARAGNAGEAGAGTGGAGAQQDKSFEVLDCKGKAIEIDPDWVNYCMVLARCGGDSSGPAWCLMSPQAGYSFYLVHPQGKPDNVVEPEHDRFELASCKASLATCDDLLACSGSRGLQGECDGNAVARCEGERAINCGSVAEPAAGVQDCQRLTGKQGTCKVVGSGQSARALCVVQEACNSPGTESCDGTKVVRCDAAGVAGGEDCAELGLTCRVSPLGKAFCAPPLPTATCDNKGFPYCDGNAAAYCNTDGIAFKGPDCAAVGDLVCSGHGTDDVDDDWWDCVPKGCSMMQWNGSSSTCDGDVYEHAMGYWTVRINCRDYGFASCKDGSCAN